MTNGQHGATLCVYALAAGTARRLTARGLAGEPLRLVRVKSVAAVVGELPRAPRLTRDHLRRYDETMRRLAARMPALLPVRFGTVFDDPAELLLVLRSRDVSLRRALAKVRNRVQMTVRVVQSGGSAARNPPHTEEPPMGPDSVRRVPRSGPGGAYLRARAAAAARAREVPGFEPIGAAVRRWVRDERVEKREGVASVYHLVPRASADSYRKAAERAGAGSGLRIVVTGPFPPYAFADLF